MILGFGSVSIGLVDKKKLSYCSVAPTDREGTLEWTYGDNKRVAVDDEVGNS
jgi:hypothetical protein